MKRLVIGLLFAALLTTALVGTAAACDPPTYTWNCCYCCQPQAQTTWWGGHWSGHTQYYGYNYGYSYTYQPAPPVWQPWPAYAPGPYYMPPAPAWQPWASGPHYYW